jgi:thiamine-monophosphate kinase
LRESELIERLTERAARRPGTELGIGDDAAILALDGRAVVAQDLLVDDVHFRLATTGARDLGHKALAVNLSDLAAMGVRPVAAFVGLVIPPRGFDADDFDLLYQGMEELAGRYGVSVAGGDLSVGTTLTLAVTVIGCPQPGIEPLRRSGGRAGDMLCVTGPLGAAAAGLALLEEPVLAERVAEAPALRDAQRRPEPRVAEGKLLAGNGATAMMDVSDGLAIDAERLARASGLRAVLLADRVPIADGVAAVAAAAGRDHRLMALAGGEDYELLAALPPDRREALGALLETPLMPVGYLEEGPPGLEVRDATGATIGLASVGWQHDV